jgi:hypothetical protein
MTTKSKKKKRSSATRRMGGEWLSGTGESLKAPSRKKLPRKKAPAVRQKARAGAKKASAARKKARAVRAAQKRQAKKLYPAGELGSAAVKVARRLNEDGELRAVKNNDACVIAPYFPTDIRKAPPIAHSTELAQRQAQDPLRRDVLLLAAESGLNPRTTYRWLTGEPINKRKGVYGTTHKTLVEVAARLGIERRGEGPVRGSEEGEDPIARDVRKLAEATDFQRRTVRRWLLGEGTVQAFTARTLANQAKELGIERRAEGSIASSLGEEREAS